MQKSSIPNATSYQQPNAKVFYPKCKSYQQPDAEVFYPKCQIIPTARYRRILSQMPNLTNSQTQKSSTPNAASYQQPDAEVFYPKCLILPTARCKSLISQMPNLTNSQMQKSSIPNAESFVDAEVLKMIFKSRPNLILIFQSKKLQTSINCADSRIFLFLGSVHRIYHWKNKTGLRNKKIVYCILFKLADREALQRTVRWEQRRTRLEDRF